MTRLLGLFALFAGIAGCAATQGHVTGRDQLASAAAGGDAARESTSVAGASIPPESAVNQDAAGNDLAGAPSDEDLPSEGASPAAFNEASDEPAETPVVAANSAGEASAETVLLDPRGEYPLSLPTALALVAGQNGQVQFARWRIQEAYAALGGANALWLPSIQAGVSYHRHDGTLQETNGNILDVNRSSLQAGFGAGAVGAGSIPNPGLVARFHTADAVFAPRIAERTAWARGHGAQAVLHDELLAAALAYLELLSASQQQAIALATLDNTLDLAKITDSFAKSGQGLQSDADRTATELALRRNDYVRAEEAIAVASARLAEIVSFDFRTRLVPVEPTVTPLHIAPVELSRQGLVAVGLRQRPELREAGCLIAEACERLQREKYAPLLPSVLLGLSHSGFGGGVGDQIGDFHDRADFDAVAVWEVRNLGFGERSARYVAGARVEQRRWEQVRLMDRVAREIYEAAAQVEARGRQIAVAEEAITLAQQSYDRNTTRITQGQGLPIEVLQAIQALDAARREYLRAVVGYNEAQFRLHRALGWPVSA